MTLLNKEDLEILSVSQATFAIKGLLESRFPILMLKGEISNFKAQSSGHLYFSLKDDKAQMAAVMFRFQAAQVKPPPKEGDQVIVKGQITVYEPKGNYQIIVKELYFVGIGALLMQIERLKANLQAKGWFQSCHKKPLPRFPQTIGVITSPTGAAIHDILNILTRRQSGFHLILNPVRVQGATAAAEIAEAIEQMNALNLVDVLIVGRGGGSIEDLLAFNDEKVAAAIFKSTIPIISAVGHETDTCIADLVADVRAPTPSAAAEIVSSEQVAHLHFLKQSRLRLLSTLTQAVRQDRYRLHSLQRHPLFSSVDALLRNYWQQTDEIQGVLDRHWIEKIHEYRIKLSRLHHLLEGLKPQTQILNFKNRLQSLKKSLSTSLKQRFESKQALLSQREWATELDRRTLLFLKLKKEKLNAIKNHLKDLDPQNLLRLGYSLLFAEKEASLIISTEQLFKGQKIHARLSDGQALLIVQEVTPHAI